MEKEPAKILIIDDDIEITEVIRDYILMLESESQTFDCDILLDGYTAMQALQKRKYDLVFIDLSMPHFRGDEVIKNIRLAEGVNQNTPFVIVSGMLPTFEVTRTNVFDDVYYVSKPMIEEKLHRLTKICLGYAA